MSNYEQFLETGKFRELKADEIEVRAAQCGISKATQKTWAQLLLYKDARVDMAILDETVGPMNWQRQHSRDNANCIISIWDKNKGQWISKEDTGTESNTEKEKGLASDSFKRSGTNWGIGRSLYSAPTIFVDAECTLGSSGKYQLSKKVKFTVKEYEVEDGKITKLVIVNQDGEEAFRYPKQAPKTNYNMMSTGTVKYQPPQKKESSKKEDFEVELPHMFDDEENENEYELDTLPFGEVSDDYNTPVTATEPVEQDNEEEWDNHPSDSKVHVKSATVGQTKNGMNFVKITYQYDGTKEEKEQFQPISTKWGIASIVKTFKEMQILSNAELDDIKKTEDVEGIRKAVGELNRTKNERIYNLEITKNDKDYDVFNLKRL